MNAPVEPTGAGAAHQADAPPAQPPHEKLTLCPPPGDHAAARGRPPGGSRPPHDAHVRDLGERPLKALQTAREGRRAAEQTLELQQAMLAVVAHELRGPIAPMSNAIALLGSVHCTDPMLARLQAVLQRQLASMTRLVGDLLDVERASRGRLSMEWTMLDIRPLIEATVQARGPLLLGRQQSMNLQLPDQPAIVRGDEVRLTQVFGNLLENASKYTPEGGLVQIMLTFEPGQHVLRFSDSGIGIGPAVLPHVFDGYVQEEHATAFNAEGLGIGLMLVRELVQAHGGQVAAHSEGRHRGSDFVVTLPQAATPNVA